MLLYLEMLINHLRLHKEEQPEIVIFDQGPVYIHAAFKARWSVNGNRDSLRAWLGADLQRWMNLLDGIVWLDAPDSILSDRVDKRAKDHALKIMDERARAVFFERYRLAYEDILRAFGNLGVPILRVRTDVYNPEQTAGIAREFIASVTTRGL